MKKLTGSVVLIGGSADASDLRYATGYSGMDPSVFIRCGRSQVLVVPLLEKGRALREVHDGIQVVTPNDLAMRKSERRRMSGWILAALREHRCRTATVSAVCPAGIVQRLERRGIRVRIAKEPLLPERAVKTAREVKAIQVAQTAAVSAMAAAIRFIANTRIAADGWLTRRGRRVTAADVRRVIDVALIERDCFGAGTIVACGRQGANPHERGSGPLKAHEPIVLDIFPQHRRSGYWGDLTRTVVRGKASPGVKRMFAAVRDAHRAAMNVTRADAPLRNVHGAAEEMLRARGFATSVKGHLPEGFVHSTGHGVGLDIHEAPAVAAVDGRLRAGNVVTIEPGLYYTNIGGMRIEDTVLVTRRGIRILAHAPIRLEV